MTNSSNHRVVGFDLARSLAIFGMVLVNFKTVMGAGRRGPDWLVWFAGLFDGRAAALFVVLAGIGISLLSKQGRIQGKRTLLTQHRRTLVKRAAFLFVVGLLYLPIWPADILHFYGLYLAFAALFLAAPAWRVIVAIVLVVAAFTVMLFTLNYSAGWNWLTLSYSGLWTPTGMVRHLFFNGFHPVLPWFAFLLLGLLLGRLDLASSSKIRRRIFCWGIAVTAAAEIASDWLIKTLSEGASFFERWDIAAAYGTDPMPPNPFYMFAAGGLACSVVAASVSIGQRFPNAVCLRPLISTGQLALTLYVAHVVLGMGILEAYGRLENQTLTFAMQTSAAFCVASVCFAHFYRKRFERGPLEAVMRFISAPRSVP